MLTAFPLTTARIDIGGTIAPWDHQQGRNNVRRRPGQEASLVPLCSNLRSFGNKWTILKKVLVTLLGHFGIPIVIQHPGNCASLAPLHYDPDHQTYQHFFARLPHKLFNHTNCEDTIQSAMDHNGVPV